MTRGLWIFVAMLASIAAGTFADRLPERRTLTVGGYQVLSADFHLHSGLGSGGSLTPWGLVTEAQRQDLDVIALTGHNETWDAHVAHAFTALVDGPIVLVGEEITSKTQDLVAIGIRDTISPSLPLREQIDEIHRQGGIAIAPHPGARYHKTYQEAGAMTALDGTEVCHPMIYALAGSADEVAAFAAGTAATPIGSSDFHWSGRLGTCRTFLFVNEPTERGILDALRAHRTVVYGFKGRAFGDPALIGLADAAGLGDVAQSYTSARGGALDWVSRLMAAAALLGIVLATRSLANRPAAERRGSRRLVPVRFP